MLTISDNCTSEAIWQQNCCRYLLIKKSIRNKQSYCNYVCLTFHGNPWDVSLKTRRLPKSVSVILSQWMCVQKLYGNRSNRRWDIRGWIRTYPWSHVSRARYGWMPHRKSKDVLTLPRCRLMPGNQVVIADQTDGTLWRGGCVVYEMLKVLKWIEDD